jgi:ribonuclease-3
MAAADFHELLKELNISYKDDSLYEKAFTHASFFNERGLEGYGDYDRLEFIGDAVLGLVVGELIYKKFGKMNSGDLSKCRASMVRGEMEASFSKKLNFDKYIKVSKGEEKSGPIKSKIMEDVFEAFIGAFYLDNSDDFNKTKRLISSFFAEPLNNFTAYENFDYKSKLQEVVQAEVKGDILYTTVKESGTSNDKVFEVEVSCNGVVLGTGEGTSKKRAEQEAAKNALEKKVM